MTMAQILTLSTTMTNTTGVIDRMPDEAADLALHVALCEQRYMQLINKFDQVDRRLDKMEDVLIEIRGHISREKSETTEKYLKWGGAVIMVLSTTLIGLVTHMLLR
jgi:hypothetical protein